MQYSSFSRLSDPIPEINLTHCSTGVVTSPNYNGSYYPDLLDKTERIEVESGKVLKLDFTYFQVQWDSSCSKDYVEIKDGNGKTLMPRSCGWSQGVSSTHTYYFQTETLTSLTNSVEIIFHTDASSHYKGWSLNWTAVTPGIFLHSQRVNVPSVRQNLPPQSCTLVLCSRMTCVTVHLTDCQDHSVLTRSSPPLESPALYPEPSTVAMRG